ncbi:DUF4347 domain-containing protein, partial [Oceanisphaera sediminis]
MNKQDTPKTLPKFRRKPLITALESRILLDGAAVATAVDMTTDVAFQQDAVHQPAPDQAVHFSDGDLALAPTQITAADPSQNNGRKEVAFVDSSVEDYQTLVDGIGAGIEVQLIDGSEDGLAQLAVWAQQNQGYDAIHILSHGSDGALQLGSLTLNDSNIAEYSNDLQQLGQTLTEHGDIMLYGCNIAAGDAGFAFIGKLGQATGTDIGASTDATGGTIAGGDWVLEQVALSNDGDDVVSPLVIAAYDDLLGGVNLGFESGMSGWTEGGTVTASGGDNYPISGSSWTVNPNGSTMASLNATSGEDWASVATDKLSLSSESKSYIDEQFTAITQVSYIYQDVSLSAGEVLSFGWNFLATDSEYYNDASFISFVNLSNVSDQPLVNNVQSEIGILGAITPGTGNYSTGSYSSTGWQTAYLKASEAGTYRIGFAVFDMKDKAVSPYLFVDDGAGTTFKNGQSYGPIAEDPNAPPPPGEVVPANAAPVIGGSSSGQNVNDTGTITPFSAVALSDAEGDNLTVNISLDSAAKGAFTEASLTASGFTDNGDGNYSLATTNAASAQTAIRQLVFDPAENRVASGSTETTTFTISVSDGTSTTNDATTTVVSTSVNDEPTLTAIASNPTFTEDGSAAILFSGTSISTVEAGQSINGLSFTVTNVTNGSNERINIDGTTIVLTHGTSGTTAGNSLSYNVSVSGTTATVLLTGGNMPTASAQTLVDGMSYQNNSQDPDTASYRVVSLTSLQDSGGTANDGEDTAALLAVASTITLVAVNDAPVLSAAATAGYTENAAATVIDNGLTLSDADDSQLTGASVTISSGLTSGDVLAASTGGTAISASYNSATGVLTLSGTDTVANYQAVLRGVTFASSSEDPTASNTTRTLQWQVTDANSDGAGTQSSTVQSTTLTVTPSNDAPVVSAAAMAAYTENASATVIDGTISLGDADDSQLTGASVTLSAGLTAGDVLAATTSGTSISASYNSATGVLTLTGTDSVANYQAVLRSVTFASSSDDPTATSATRTLQWQVTDADSDDAGAESSNVQSTTLAITPSNDAPMVSAAATAAYTENASATVIDGTISLGDADDSQLTGASVTLSAGLTSGDVLAATTTGTVISASYDSATGVLTLTGTDSVANYQAVLRSVTFACSSDDPTATSATRTLQWQVTDANSDDAGAESSNVQSTTLTVTPLNDAPVAKNDSNIATEAGGVVNATAGGEVRGDVLGNDSDVDSADTSTVTGVVFGDTSGTVGTALNGQYGSLTLNEDGSYSYVIDESNAAVQALRTSGQTLSETFGYTVTDAAGATDTATLTITIKGSNDAPVATDDTAIAVEAGGEANGSVGSNASGNVLANDSDVDSVANGETKAVTTVEFGDTGGTVGTALNGQYGRLTLNADGSYSYVIDENNAAVQALRTSGQTLSETFGYTVTDAAGATDTATLTITIKGSNDAPVATDDTAIAVEAGGEANGSVGSNASGNVLANDSDVDSVANGETKAVTTVEFGDTGGTVGTALNGQYGSLTLNEDGSYSYVIDESNAAVQALRTSGQTLSEAFGYTVTDAAGATDTATLTITLQGQNDAPVATDDTAIAVEAGGEANGSVGSNASGNVLNNDSDVDSVANGETKVVTTVEFGDTGGTVGTALNGQYGSLTLNEDGSYSYVID